MKRLHIVYCLPFISLVLISMDDDDIYNAPEESEEYDKSDYVFPPLVAKHVYPIHIYEWYSYQKRLRPLFGDKEDFRVYKEAETLIEEKYETLLKGVRDKVTKDDLMSIKNRELAMLQKKHADKTNVGTFIIYTAINKEQRFKHPWYCVVTLKLQERVVAEIKCAEEAKSTFYLKPDKFKYTYKPPAISLMDKTECDDTLRMFIKILSKQDVIIHVGNPIYYWIRPKPKSKSTEDMQSTGDQQPQNSDWVLEKGECPMDACKSGDANLRKLYDKWPQHESKDRLKELMDKNSIEFTPFIYTASPSSSSEDTSTVVLREVEVLTVNPSYTQPSSSRSSSRFSNSTTYKLQ